MYLSRVARVFRTALRSYRPGNYAALSTMRYDIHQSGMLGISLNNASTAKVEIVTTWEDFVEIEVPDDATLDIEADTEENAIFVSGADSSSLALTARIPQRFNCYVQAQGPLDINVSKKLEGQLNISCPSGRVDITKIRGPAVDIEVPGGDVFVHECIEGDVRIDCCNIHAKMLNGNSVHIRSHDPPNSASSVNIEACYAPQAVILAEAADVAIAGVHGSVSVATLGSAKLQGVNGSFDIQCNGDIAVDIRKLAPNSISKAISKQGVVTATLDPSITTERVNIRAQRHNGEEVPIHLEEAASTRTIREKSSGKINIAAAEAQSLRYFIQRQSQGNNSQPETSNNVKPVIVSEIYVQADDIQMRYLSWMDAIKQKHGVQ